MGQFYNILILMVWFTLVIGEEEEWFFDDYCFVNSAHVLCYENRSLYSKCPEQVSLYNLTQSEQEEVVNTFNGLRSKVASGKIKWNKSSKGIQAANMMQMRWDDELAMAATSIAGRCTDKEPCFECLLLERFPMNFIQKAFPIGITTQPLPWRIYLNEIIQQGFNAINMRNNDFQILVNKITPMDHLLWAETYLVGCGLAIYPSDGVVVHHVACGFGPVGPIGQRKLFQPGSPCSECPFGPHCSEKFPSLCECQNDKCFLSQNSARARRDATPAAALGEPTTVDSTGIALPTQLPPDNATAAGDAAPSTEKDLSADDNSQDGAEDLMGYEEYDYESSDAWHPIAYSLHIHILYVLVVGSIFKF